jgi:hypothetical protein
LDRKELEYGVVSPTKVSKLELARTGGPPTRGFGLTPRRPTSRALITNVPQRSTGGVTRCPVPRSSSVS